MPPKKFHLAWFTMFDTDEWLDPVVGRRQAVGRRVLCRHGEGAGAGLLRLHHARGHADGVAMPIGGTRRGVLKSAIKVPKHDPMPLAAVIGAADDASIGIVATMSTMAYPPFLLARARLARSIISPAAASAGTS